MRTRSRVVAAAVAVAAAGLVPAVAHAATPTTLYVDDTAQSCMDSGTGTQAVPFCSLQAAVNAAVAGDTVLLEQNEPGGGGPSEYSPANITTSGTAAAPILIEGQAGADVVITDSGPPTGATGLAFNGASYVNVSNISMEGVTRYATFTNSSHITLDAFQADPVFSSGTTNFTVPGIEIYGNSSAITLSRGSFLETGRSAPSVQIDAGSTGDTVTTSILQGGDPSILVNGATGTDITSNTVVASAGARCGTGIMLTGAATGASIENNILVPAASCTATGTPAATGLLNVASTAVSGTTADYNLLGPGNQSNEYAWGGKYYSTAAAFNAASGQGKHDIVANPNLSFNGTTYYLPNTGPFVNDANSAAPGELTTDEADNTRVNDSLVPDSGAGTYGYYDRGALQLQPVAPGDGVEPTGVGALGVQAMTEVWSSTPYEFNFGDGTPTVTGAYGIAQHTYKVAGKYTITVSGTASGTGTPFTESNTYNTPVSGTMYHDVRNANGSWQAGGWSIPGSSTGLQHVADTAMRDGSTQFVGVTAGGVLEHNIRFANGSWQGWRALSQPGVVVTGADIAGMPDGSSQIVEETTTGPLLHDIRFANGSWQSQGWANILPPETNLFDTAITAMPDGSTQFVAVNQDNELEHDIRFANGTWQGWNVVHQAADYGVFGADIAGMPDGSAQIVEVTQGGVFHDIRFANGSWQSQGWAKLGAPATAQEVAITAMPNGSSQFVEVTSTGKIYHDIRFANGSWQPQGWAALPLPNSLSPIVGADIAGMPNGSSQIIALSGN